MHLQNVDVRSRSLSVIINEDDISHNHGPFASRIINDLLELDAPQRLLTKDEQDEIGKKLAEGASVEEASNLMVLRSRIATSVSCRRSKMMTAWSYWRFLIHHLLDKKQMFSLECLREDRAQRDQLHQARVQVQAFTYWLRSKSQQLNSYNPAVTKM